MVLTEALCNVALSVALIRPFGILGVALGTMIPAVVFNAFLVPATACRLIGIPVVGFITSTALRPLAAGAALLPVGWTISHYIVSHSWAQFSAKAAVLAMVGIGIAAAIGMTAEDRAQGIRIALEMWSRVTPMPGKASDGPGAGSPLE
jgi:O-antigen/teichoic acid export membrane protein